MPIKDVTFSFKVPIEELLSLVVKGNVGMRVDAYGDQPRLAKNGQLALPGPMGKKGAVTDAVIKAFLLKDDHVLNTTQLREIALVAGGSKNSIHGIVFKLKKDGILLQVGPSVYRLSAKGLKELAHG